MHGRCDVFAKNLGTNINLNNQNGRPREGGDPWLHPRGGDRGGRHGLIRPMLVTNSCGAMGPRLRGDDKIFSSAAVEHENPRGAVAARRKKIETFGRHGLVHAR